MTTQLADYWTATEIVVFSARTGGAAEAAGAPRNINGVAHMGYLVSVVTIIGVRALLGAVAAGILWFRRLTEGAYAGIFLNMSGAVRSRAVPHAEGRHVIVARAVALLAPVSRGLRPGRRTLGVLLLASARSSAA